MSQTVIVTGVSSFAGVHLASRFARAGFRVLGTISQERDAYQGIQEKRLRALPEGVELATVDLQDARGIGLLAERFTPDLWIHHAGYAAVYASLEYDLSKGLSTNVLALDHVYQALAHSECAVIMTGSSAEYAACDVGNREDDGGFPATPYGIAKLAQTMRAAQLAERYAVSTRVARLYIPFGSLDHPEKLFSIAVRGLRTNTGVRLSACTQVRDFIGIGDVCDGYLALLKDMPRQRFDVFNICSGVAVPVRDALCLLAKQMGADGSVLQFGAIAMREGEALISYGSSEKARRMLGWRTAPLEDAVQRDLLAAIDCAQ